jgi:hypothetical protein
MQGAGNPGGHGTSTVTGACRTGMGGRSFPPFLTARARTRARKVRTNPARLTMDPDVSCTGFRRCRTTAGVEC